MLVFAVKSSSRYLWLFALLQLSHAQDISENSQEPKRTRKMNPFYNNRPQRSPLVIQGSCAVPPQPEHGVRRRHEYYCGEEGDCDIAEGVELAPGTLLNYTCNPGYKMNGEPYVWCQGKGIWSPIPVCTEVKCDSLNSASTNAECFLPGRWVSCNSTILNGTRAKISCRPGYVEVTPRSDQSRTVECRDGKWKPEPIACEPVCGVLINESTTDLPWRASIHKLSSQGPIIYFKCGATIVRTNLVLTAASCVFDVQTKSTIASRNLFVISGNKFKSYYSLHESETVLERAVKDVHIHCNYSVYGPQSARASPFDIALVEIQKPFEFTSTFVPACLAGSNNAETIIEPGSYGKIAEAPTKPAAKDVSLIKTVSYVPYKDCQISGRVFYAKKVTSDKFCAGHDTRSSVCVWDRGNGLVFERNNLWYVMGVVAEPSRIALSGMQQVCDTYAMYTNVTEYAAWIQDVIFNVELYNSNPPCARSPIRTPNLEGSVCLAPPQPKHGTFNRKPCKDNENCEILQGAQLNPGTQLVYSCNPGYKVSGNIEVYCGFTGNWSIIPVCTEIRCDPLTSKSTRAACYDRFGAWVSCVHPVPPGTRAEVSCQPGYMMDSGFATFKTESVSCNEDGMWTPHPITCSPVCGVTNTHQIALAIGATPAKIGDFPWHATLYRQKISPWGITKEFICGASIIRSNFLLTAAHCVYDEGSRTKEDPKRFFVMTGNVFREYDSPFHNPEVVKKGSVKNVYIPCNYYGYKGNYVSDIALLELNEPFTFSGILLPICLDFEEYARQILEPGAVGRVAGFGRTATGSSSGLLQTLSLPYVAFSQCRNSTTDDENDVLISKDKFCAGYTNGSAVCEGDSGGGLVFKKGDLWYVMGIVSVGLGVDFDNGEKTCDRYSYSLYTRVSEHIMWIRYVMFQRARNKSYPSCDATG